MPLLLPDESVCPLHWGVKLAAEYPSIHLYICIGFFQVLFIAVSPIKLMSYPKILPPIQFVGGFQSFWTSLSIIMSAPMARNIYRVVVYHTSITRTILSSRTGWILPVWHLALMAVANTPLWKFTSLPFAIFSETQAKGITCWNRWNHDILRSAHWTGLPGSVPLSILLRLAFWHFYRMEENTYFRKPPFTIFCSLRGILSLSRKE